VNAAKNSPGNVAMRDSLASDDDALLSAFFEDGDEGAFGALAARHAGWVYAAAFRQLRDRHAAEDATQAVFVLLWQRGRGLAGKRRITGWLFRAVDFTVRAMQRAERRRRAHESRAALVAHGGAGEPLLPSTDIDAAVAALGDADRTAILLRFHRELEFADVARELGVSPVAARQRVSRAVERLRGRLGAGVTPSSLASAVAFGAHSNGSEFGGQAARAALRAARGEAPAGGVGAAVTGATHLMAMSKAKLVVVFLALATVLATSAVAVLSRQPAGDPADQVYALGPNEVIRRVPARPGWERMEFLRRSASPGDRLDHPDGAMIVRWKDGRVSLWGRKSSSQGWYTLGDLVGNFMRVPPWELEGEAGMRNLRLDGDFAINRQGSVEQFRAGIEKIASEELGKKLTLAFKDVERPVVVFRGRWRQPASGAGRKPGDAAATLDLYVDKPDPTPAREATGTLAEAAAAVSDYLGRQVLIECQNAPAQVLIRASEPFPGNPLKQVTGSIAEDVLRHVEQQTGLKANREKRRVRRLFIETD
jgi:RNA polymerase sigma factor (sigma-70 family)